MKDVIKLYEDYCIEKGIAFQQDTLVKPYGNSSTLFCVAGMQKYVSQFKDPNYEGTFANSQPCIRLNDLDSIADSTHFLYFNMLGLFSFRQWTVEQAIDFWMEFVQERLGLKVDRATIHPVCMEWWKYYHKYQHVKVETDFDCEWTDGELGGYCTEFYINGVEIGNIVNCNGDCIDVGFGLERLDMLVNGTAKDELSVLKETIEKIIESGYVPGPKLQGYVLRKLIKLYSSKGGIMDNEIFSKEMDRIRKGIIKYHKLRDKYQDKDAHWWKDTHGIDLDEIS